MMLSSFYKITILRFETSEIPPGIYEVSGIKNTLDKFLKANVSVDIITKKP